MKPNGLSITLGLLLLPVSFAQLGKTNAPAGDAVHTYCQSCHLFPEPSLLDKQSWINGALRRMAPFLGAGRVDLERRPDGNILKEAGIFPSTPLVSEKDWREIVRYYRDHSPEIALPQKSQPRIELNLERFKVHPLKYPGSTHLTSLVRIDSGKSRFYIGNAAARALDRVSLEGNLLSRTELDSAPVDLTVRPEGIYVTLIGDLFPSDERKGKLVLVSEANDATGVRTILDNLSRPTSTTFADLNNDGREDLVLCAFGNYLGRFAWYERTSKFHFVERVLLEQPGSVNSAIHVDPKGSGPEIYLLTAQAREGIHRFRRSKGAFVHETIADFHPAFGSSHLEVVDFNKDGFPDLLVTNGDNGDYPSRPKSYHGVRLYLNDGKGHFHEAWFHALHGAFKAMPADFDQDGDLDIAVISYFPDYTNKPEESFVYLENHGGYQLTGRSFPECVSGRWLTMDCGDVDNDGDIDIVLGAFAEGPASVPIPADLQQRWRTNGYSAVWLENRDERKVNAP